MTLQLLSTGFIKNLHELKDALAVDIENASFDRRNGPIDLYALSKPAHVLSPTIQTPRK